ncbi:MAG: hypothetical protein M3Z67_08705, partial [Commensalibacter sp.]|nr:hypothetical protein [Commensalibacter sp.]
MASTAAFTPKTIHRSGFGDANDAKIKAVSVLHHRIVPRIFSLFKTQGLYWPRQALNRIFKTARFPLKLL